MTEQRAILLALILGVFVFAFGCGVTATAIVLPCWIVGGGTIVACAWRLQ